MLFCQFYFTLKILTLKIKKHERAIKHIFSAFTICTFLFLAYSSSESDVPEKRTSITEIEAKVVAEGQVEAVLKAPSTAKFSGLRDTKMTIITNGYNVTGYVDSQNGFGAMIRSKYSVDIFLDKESGDIMYRNLTVN